MIQQEEPRVSALRELASIAAKVVTEKASKGKSFINEAANIGVAGAVGELTEQAAKKVGLLQTNKYGELFLKVPFFKTVEDKIAKAFAEHPERGKVCFHFVESIRNGVVFYDPDGNETFKICGNKKNLRQIELYEGNRYVGRIEKHITINLNPFKNLQKYDAIIRNTSGIIAVNWFDVSTNIAPWWFKHRFGGNYNIRDMANGNKEIGKVYSFGNFNFVLDYDKTVDPALLLLEFMAIKIRMEEFKRNHQNADKKSSTWIDNVIADIKDVF